MQKLRFLYGWAMEAAWPTSSTRILSLAVSDDPLPTILIRPDTEE